MTSIGTSSVYISSTFEDLKQYRAAVFEALDKAGFGVGRMEGYAASDDRPLQSCLNDVESRDIYVGIFAWRYGYIPPKEHGNVGGLSITECEYRHALLKNKPTLCFFHDPKATAQWPDEFKDEVTGQSGGGSLIRALRKNIGTEKMGDFFNTPWELAAKVLAAILRHGSVRRPFTVPPLPQGFVPRPEITGKVVSALLADEKVPLAIHGAGGFGKSTLAIAVCHEPEVIRAFPDGIVWVTLGEKDPQVERQLREIHAEFTGEQPVETTAPGISATVRQKLSGKSCLIVVDDVWNYADLTRFTDLGIHRLLFTTRRREVVSKYPKIEVQEMTTVESVRLLVRDIPEAASHQKAFEDFAEELGGWALLLELTNARLLAERDRPTLGATLEYVMRLYRERGVTALGRMGTKDRNDAVANCLEVGLELYKESVPTLRVRAAELGLFPEDTPIPEQVLCEFWDCDEITLNEDTLRYLDDLSIIRCDRRARVVRVHDSVRAALATWIPEKKASHRRLLEAWSDPMQLPHEYAWRWYGWHCLEAGDPKRLRNLLLNPTWLQAKLDNTNVNAIISDCERLAKEITDHGSDSKVAQSTVPNSEERTIRLLSDALRKSAHVLVRDPSQLSEQLFGRLRPGMSPDLDSLREQLQTLRQNLRALFANLEPAGSPLQRTLQGPNGSVSGALLLPDGKRALSRGSDGTLRLWNLQTGKQVGEPLTGHEGQVSGALVLPDGKRALSWGSDGTLRLWNLQTGKPVGEPLTWHEGVVFGVLLLPDGKRALSWGSDGTLRLWNLQTGKQVSEPLTGQECQVYGALLLPDGKRAVSWGDGTLRLWNLQTGKQVSEPLTGQECQVSGVLLLPDGKRALSWGMDGTLRMWNLQTGKQVGEPLTGHEGHVSGALLLPDGERALSKGVDGTLRVWNLETGKQIGGPLTGHEGHVFGALLLPDGERALSWGVDGTLRLWNLETGKQVGESLSGHEGSVGGALLLPDGKRALSWGMDGTLRLWDSTACMELARFYAEGPVSALVDCGRLMLFVGDNTGRVYFLELVER